MHASKIVIFNPENYVFIKQIKFVDEVMAFLIYKALEKLGDHLLRVGYLPCHVAS